MLPVALPQGSQGHRTDNSDYSPGGKARLTLMERRCARVRPRRSVLDATSLSARLRHYLGYLARGVVVGGDRPGCRPQELAKGATCIAPYDTRDGHPLDECIESAGWGHVFKVWPLTSSERPSRSSHDLR
jgi:hypothetical protein